MAKGDVAPYRLGNLVDRFWLGSAGVRGEAFARAKALLTALTRFLPIL